MKNQKKNRILAMSNTRTKKNPELLQDFCLLQGFTKL